MKPLLLLASFFGGILVAWLSVLGGIWYVAPFGLVAAGFVSIALDKASRWRIAVFALGMIAVYVVEARSFVHYVDEQQQRARQRIRTEPAPTPRPQSGLFS